MSDVPSTEDLNGDDVDSPDRRTGSQPQEDRDPGGEEHAVDPATAFSLLGDEIRLEIVTTLHGAKSESPIPFSELHARVSVRDSGQFNYHLSELVPHFVSKDERGYDLTAAGKRIARALDAGMYTDSPVLGPFDIEGRCHDCGTAALIAAYSDECLRIRCEACDQLLIRVTVPPSVIRNRSHEAVIDAVDQWSRIQVEQAWEGLCPNCGGAVTWELWEEPPEHLGLDVLPSFRCDICGIVRSSSFGGLAYYLPEVQSFHRRHGIDLEERPYWEIDFVINTTQTVLSKDPWRIRTTSTAGDEACHVVFDENIDVVRTTVVDRSR